MSERVAPLAAVRSIKVKLGLLVAVSVLVAVVLALVGRAGDVPLWLVVPVALALALAVTQLLAVGMVAPLREMTAAARRMAGGDYGVRVSATSQDEVGALAGAFNSMARDLATVDARRRDLVADVSHELRTPLAAQRAVLENLVDGIGGRTELETALGQAERLSALVDDLLDLARVDAGKAPLTPVPVRLATVLDEAVGRARGAGRAVEYDVRVDPELEVHADPQRLDQLVTNLLDNATRHSPAGGTVTVVGALAPDAAYVIEVIDEGNGIAPEDRERVFERFGTRQVSTGSTTNDDGGTGLGLSIARWVTDLHGGSIGFVDPEPGTTGARARAVLPLQPAVRPLPPTQEPRMPTTPPPPPPSQQTWGAAPTAVAPPRLLDDLFGRFWPDGAPARLDLLGGALAVGVLAGLIFPFRDHGIGTFLVLAAAGLVVLHAGRRSAFQLACGGLALLLTCVVFVRDAEWIVALSLFSAIGVTLVGATGGRTFVGFVTSGLAWPLSALRGMPWLGRTVGRLGGVTRHAALLRTVAWSVLALLIFGALFISADALLAEWIDKALPELTPGSAVLRVFITVAVGGVVLAAAYLGLNPPRVDATGLPPRTAAQRYEWLAPVAVVNAVFAAFLLAQATVIFGGHGYLQRTTGLTYADYVHQGFGQLTVATALTLIVVWAAARKADRSSASDRLVLRIALGLLCLQTLVVVASALYRMHVYQEAYGFTTLRLTVDVFEGWLGVVVIAVMVAGVGLRGAWLARFALLSGATAVLGLAAINPDAWVASQNIDRWEETGKLDCDYLTTLSMDAVPTLAELPDGGLAYYFLHGDGSGRSADDWLEWNLGRERAYPILRESFEAGPAAAGVCVVPVATD